ncbi:hypothetical protein Tco_1030774 [Tanacetum coccineum]|uniref:Uncharacterized protein n=1 Tax=Tanacetum coccineum TaxID=301880 RepID=A0ABQ5G763_9ASTR
MGPLDHLARMLVDHMHQPWRNFATIINKSLSRKTSSNDKLRQSRVAISWSIFYRKNVNYLELIREDLAYQIDYKQEKLRRHEIIPYLRFTKIIINHFLLLNPSIPITDLSQPHTRGSSEGTGIIPRVPDKVKDSFEAKGDSVIDWGSEEESEYSEENRIDEEIEQVSIDEEEEKQDDQDGDDDRSIDIEKTDDEKETDDEFAHGNVDEEMKDAKVVVTGKDAEEIINESVDTEINSLWDIQIQQELPLIESPFVLTIPILVIPEPIVLSPIPEVSSVTPVTTLPPPPSVTNVTPVLQQQTTPIPTPPITTTAPVATTVPDPLTTII